MDGIAKESRMKEIGKSLKIAVFAVVLLLLCGCSGVQGTKQPTIRSATHTAPFTEQVPVSTVTLTQTPLPRFEPASCQFVNAYRYDVECGYLVVPEDRGQSDGPTVRLHVAIFKSTNPDPEPDPVIYLAGGGGVNHLDSSGYYLNHGGYEILETRDYIMYNQRGAHYNQPMLECPDYNTFLSELAGENLSSEEYHASKLEFLLECRDDLMDRGINLEMYNSAVNAADLNDLRHVLGYDQVNLYGTSYGTRLALTMMRDFPQGVRSAIIDSVYPPQVDYFSEYAVNAHQAYLKLFESCSVDPFCRETYPDLEDVFYHVMDDLNANPSSFTWMDEPVMFNGGVFSEAIYLMLYTAEIGIAPKAIFEASRGDFSIIEPYILGALDITTTHLSWGAYYSIHCSEEALLDTFNHALTLSADLPPQILDYYLWTGPSAAVFNFDLCTSWGVEPANNIESEPIVSDIPTLLLAGQFDPITPSDWAQLAANTLGNNYFYEFPGLGHGVMRSNRCALEIGLQFINDPSAEPDTSCIEDLGGPDYK
jgi:pimeloyl-ACP methyl ester carboxylesterase